MRNTAAPQGPEDLAVSPAIEQDSPKRRPSGLDALCLIARLHQVAADPAHLAHQLGWPPSHPPSPTDLLLAAKHLGLKAKLSRSNLDRLALVPLPALALLRGEAGTLIPVVLAQCDGKRVLFQDPSGVIQGGRPVIEPFSVFAEQWTGELILISSRASLAGELARFDFSWFIPSLVKYRKLFGEVLLVSLFLQLFALVIPLFFQVVMDNRRWWTVPVLDVDYQHSIDMQQVWAEVKALFEQGEQWWLTQDEMAEVNTVNGAHQATSALDEIVARAFRPAEVGGQTLALVGMEPAAAPKADHSVWKLSATDVWPFRVGPPVTLNLDPSA